MADDGNQPENPSQRPLAGRALMTLLVLGAIISGSIWLAMVL